MNRRPPRSTRPVTLFPDTTLGRSGIRFKKLPGQFHQRLVLLEKPWQVHGKSPVIGLLIEINGTSPELRGLKVRGYVYRTEEHTSELQSLMRISYAVFCLKNKTRINTMTRKMKNTTTTVYNIY